MKKKILTIICASTLVATSVIPTFGDVTSSKIKVLVNGTNINFSQEPIMQNDRLLVPLRETFEALKMEVTWNEKDSSITSKSNTHTVFLKIGAKTAKVNEKDVALDIPAQIIDGRTLVPLRFVSESTGYTVHWNGTDKIVTIANDGSTPAPASTPTPVPATPKEEATVLNGMSTNIYDYQFKLDGVVYSMPDDYSKFSANGWKIEAKKASFRLQPNGSASTIRMEKGKASQYVNIVNPKNEEATMANSKVYSFRISFRDLENNINFELTKGINFNSNYDDIVKAYGAPTEERYYENKKGVKKDTILTYKTGIYASIEITVSGVTGKVRDVNIERIANERDMGKPDPKTAAPKEITSYVAPQSLGDDWNSFNVNYGGALVTMPAPVDAFIKGGFVYESDKNYIVQPNSLLTGFKIRSGNQVLSAVIVNFSDTDQPIYNCHVVQIESSVGGTSTTPKIPFTLPKGITYDSTEASVIAAYGNPDSIYESKTTKYLSYFGKPEGFLRIGISVETGKVTDFSIDIKYLK